MTAYCYPSWFFRKEWRWFEYPIDTGADIINVFSYDAVDVEGFKKKRGLTTVINIEKSESELWAAMRKKFIREQVEKGIRNGITVIAGIDWKEFVPIYEEFRKEKGIIADDPRVFQHCLISGAYYEGKLVAGGAFVGDGTHLRALALASLRFRDNGRMREIVGQANRMLIWETMRRAKRDGYRLVDLGGIAPESNNIAERSLAEFKEAFGGERRTCYYYTKVNSPILKLLLAVRRKLGL